MGMTIISLNIVPPKLRGFLTKYLWEINTGVYIGNLNARVREQVWIRCQKNLFSDSRLIMAYSSNNEQGFEILSFGSKYIPVDYDGLKLILKATEQNNSLVRNPINEFVVLDLETTGTNVEQDEIIKIGAILVKEHNVVSSFQMFIQQDVSASITELTGISNKDTQNGQNHQDALVQLNEFIAGRPVVGYNIRGFDSKILKNACLKYKAPYPLINKVIDVLEIAWRDTSLKSYKMHEVAEKRGIDVLTRHRAISDCQTCLEIYQSYGG